MKLARFLKQRLDGEFLGYFKKRQFLMISFSPFYPFTPQKSDLFFLSSANGTRSCIASPDNVLCNCTSLINLFSPFHDGSIMFIFLLHMRSLLKMDCCKKTQFICSFKYIFPPSSWNWHKRVSGMGLVSIFVFLVCWVL